MFSRYHPLLGDLLPGIWYHLEVITRQESKKNHVISSSQRNLMADSDVSELL
jgi:hypothetical protein